MVHFSFEEYEQLILNTNNPCKFDMISDVQFSCSTILSEILQLEDNDMYFVSFCNIFNHCLIYFTLDSLVAYS